MLLLIVSHIFSVSLFRRCAGLQLNLDNTSLPSQPKFRVPCSTSPCVASLDSRPIIPSSPLIVHSSSWLSLLTIPSNYRVVSPRPCPALSPGRGRLSDMTFTPVRFRDPCRHKSMRMQVVCKPRTFPGFLSWDAGVSFRSLVKSDLSSHGNSFCRIWMTC